MDDSGTARADPAGRLDAAGGASRDGPGRQRGARPPTDRFFQWVAALAALGLVGFVLFVVVRGPSRTARPGSAALAAPPPSLLAPGTVAPPFTLPALGGGSPVTLSAFRGRPVVVNFFASWCPDCRAELEAVATEAQVAGDRVAFVGVDTNETSMTAATRLLAEVHAAYPVGVDADAEVATGYLVQALPVSYFLDAQGKVVGTALGPQSVASLRRWLARLEEQR